MHILASLADIAPIAYATVEVPTIRHPDGTSQAVKALVMIMDPMRMESLGMAHMPTPISRPARLVRTRLARLPRVPARWPVSSRVPQAAVIPVEMFGDRDVDGNPDEWEDRFGTDPDVQDADQDPNGDGSNNHANGNVVRILLTPILMMVVRLTTQTGTDRPGGRPHRANLRGRLSGRQHDRR